MSVNTLMNFSKKMLRLVNILVVYIIVLLSSKVESYKSDVHRIALDSDGTVWMSWVVRSSGEIYIKIDPPLQEPYNWFGLGFSDRGDHEDSDYCVLWRDWRGHLHLQDTFSDENSLLNVDIQQDCKDFPGIRPNEMTFSRKLDTCDVKDNDYIIQADTTHIVWARGRDTLTSLRGLNVSSPSPEDKGMVRAQLIRARGTGHHPPDTRALELLTNEVQVPAEETTYWCHVHKLDSSLKQKHHVVQFEAVIQKGNEGLVHHMEVFHCEATPDTTIPLYVGPCEDPNRPQPTRVCKKVLAAWAMGAGPFVYPEEAGLPIGGENFNQHIMIEIHYNNPGKKSDFIDSSGLRMYITKSLRDNDAAVIELGLEYTDKMAIPPGEEEFMLSGYCIPECTAVSLPPEGITVFGSQLHTHLTGVRVFTRHIRDGRELPELNRDDHYSTHFQEIRLLRRRVRILPGDALITTCGYRTTHLENVTLGGFAISDEMCVNYIHYFPATQLEVCKSAISDEALDGYFRFLREWENQRTSTSLGINDNYHSINWSPLRSQMLAELYHEAPLGMQCNMSSGLRFPGYWSNSPIPQIPLPLPPPARNCQFEENIK